MNTYSSIVVDRTVPLDALSQARKDRFTIFLRASIVILLLMVLGNDPSRETLVTYFFYGQDYPLGLALMASFAMLAVMPGGASGFGSAVPGWARSPAIVVTLLAGALVAVGLVGHHLVMWGYQFSRDEQLVLFDAAVFRSGHFAARVPEDWQQYATALNTLFMPEAVKGVGAISQYRPGNAVLHAFVSYVADPSLTNPVLAAIGLFATWRVAKRIMPDDPESQIVAVLLFATSTQVMAMAMTTYAMSGRLALGMIWLALFLRDRWWSHLASLAIAFVAIGWQQLAYFPAFAGSFLFFLLVMQRRWGWSAVYATVFGFSIVFWSRYSIFAIRELGVVPGPVDVDNFLLTRLWWAISYFSPAYLWTQSAYLLRFFTWENVLLLPLLVAGIPVALRRRDPLLLAILGAIATFVVMKTLFRPYQGHGWGYRYMHDIIGIVCLVAALGWRDLRIREVLGPRHLVAATLASVLIFTPILLIQARHFSGTFARVDRAITQSAANIVIIDDTVPEFTGDLVINPPYLDQRPVRLLATHLSKGDMADLCRRGSVGFVGAPELSSITAEFERSLSGIEQAVPPLREAAVSEGCSIVRVHVRH
ncbi:MAG: hypothetical protein ACK4NZ_00030 [Tsuneonella sp.]